MPGNDKAARNQTRTAPPAAPCCTQPAGASPYGLAPGAPAGPALRPAPAARPPLHAPPRGPRPVPAVTPPRRERSRAVGSGREPRPGRGRRGPLRGRDGASGAAVGRAAGRGFPARPPFSRTRTRNSITVASNLLFKLVLRFNAFPILLCHLKSIHKTLYAYCLN